MQMIQDWVSLATEENLEFGRDADNGIFQLVVAKHRGYFLVEAKETNLFTATGYQVKHAMTNYEYKKLNWDALSLMPCHSFSLFLSFVTFLRHGVQITIADLSVS